MAVFTGQGGNVTFAAGYVTNVKSFEVNVPVDIHDSTVFNPAVTWKSKTGGLKEGSGSYVCYLDTAVAIELPGVTGVATFLESGARTVTGTILISNVALGVDVGGGLSEVTFSFEFNGEVAFN